jgi:hypothetical protein
VTTQHVLQNLALAVVLVCISVSVQVALSLLVVRLFQRLGAPQLLGHCVGFTALIITIMLSSRPDQYLGIGVLPIVLLPRFLDGA